MAFFDRIWLAIRANINHWLGQEEDPEKLLEQAVLDMQEDLIQLRQAVAQAIATQKRTERQCGQAQVSATTWYQRAQLAMQKGDESLARDALAHWQPYQTTAETMKLQLEQQELIVTKLKQDMRILEHKIAEAKTRKDLYIARARSAQAAQRIHEMMGQMNTKSSLSAFERMEERVLELEAQSEAMAELGSSDLEKRFSALETGNQVEAELEVLRAKTLAENNSGHLPAGRPGSGPSSAVEDGIGG